MSCCTEWVPLGELGEIVSGATPSTLQKQYWDGDIPWITPADLTHHEGVYFTGSLRKITEAGYKSCSTRLLPTGSILFSSRAPIGHCAVTTFPLCTNQGFKSVVPNNRLDSVYGFFALTYLKDQIIARGRGATFAEISKEIMESVQIPLVALPEQQRIAAILERADRLRRLRRYALQLSDTYLQAVFLEMFGDPVRNPKGWAVNEMARHIEGIRYGTGSPPEYVSSGIPFVRATNVKRGTVQREGLAFISAADAHKIEKCRLKAGNLILVRSGANTGDCALVPAEFDGAYAAYDLIIEAAYPYNVYFGFLINSPYGKALIQRLSRRAGQPHLNAEQAKALRFPIPPTSLIERFAGVYRSVERLRANHAEAQRQAEHLFQTLLQRAFRGEL